MNKIRTVTTTNPLNGDYFKVQFSRTSSKYLKDIVSSIDFDNYIIMKATNKQKIITKKEFEQFQNAKYIFFKKGKFNIDNIMEWCEFNMIIFLDKPAPPFPTTKIIIKQ